MWVAVIATEVAVMGVVVVVVVMKEVVGGDDDINGQWLLWAVMVVVVGEGITNKWW